MITQEEFDKIKKDFDRVVTYSQSIYNPKTDELLAKWREAKSYFIDRFGGLIWQSPEKVVFPLDQKDKESKLNNFIENYVLYRYSNYDLARFLEFEKEGFFDNTVVNEYKTQDGAIIQKGMKLVKAFKFFFDLDYQLEDVQQKASMLIQENKVEGYFCISVHPLDFLSASENKHNWRSCHALDGEYRGGNLSYLLDKDTVMCYLKSDEDVTLPNFPYEVPWNNKKWRMWLHLADEHNAMMAGRQYPFTIGGVLDYAKAQLFRMVGFSTYRWTLWHHDMLNSYTFKDGTEETVNLNNVIVMNYQLVPIKSIVEDAKNSHHFDDLLYSSYYTPWYCWRMGTNAPIHFTIGSEVPCLKCGSHHLDTSDSFCCSYCDNRARCHNCGNPIDDDYYVVEGDVLCPNCFDEYAVECCNCGEYVYRDNAYYDYDNGNWYCESCWAEHDG